MTAHALMLLGALLGASDGAPTGCPASAGAPEHINQGVPATVHSAGCRWSVEVRPEAGVDGSARLYLRDHRAGSEHRLFDLARDGTLVWSKDGSWLAVEDLQSVGSYRLLFFPLTREVPREGDAAKADALVRSAVAQRLGRKREVQFYYPRFVAWTERGAVISVSSATPRGELGAMTAHCFGYEVSVRRPRILRTLEQGELRERFGATCELTPDE